MLDRICTKCRHCQWPEFATGNPQVLHALATCHHPRLDEFLGRWPYTSVTEDVTGMQCHFVRQHGGCAIDGHWFEPRKGEAGA